MTAHDLTRTFLVECYLPGISEHDVAGAATRAREAASELAGMGARIEYLGAVYVAQDEVVFHAFGARDAAVVDRASRRAGLRFERIVESVAVGGAEPLGRLPGARVSNRE